MGYIDCDAHLYETESTWDQLDPSERQFRPAIVRSDETGAEYWLAGDQRLTKMDRALFYETAKFETLYPPGTINLADVPARLAHMDRLGVDIQVLFSTFFIQASFERPLVEAALARSYNRWMAERTAGTGGRLRWSLVAPLRMMDRAFAEMEFGKEHGAVGVHIRGEVAGMVLDDEYLNPFYAHAQDLDLTINVHIGLYSRVGTIDARATLPMVMQVIAGFHRLAVSDIPERFPRLRFSFLEAGASWLPFALHEAARGTPMLLRRTDDNVALDPDLLSRKNLFVTCQVGDDLPYLLRFTGPDNLIVGTDYGHLDVGADLEAHQIFARRTDVDPDVLRRILDANGRRLLGLVPVAA